MTKPKHIAISELKALPRCSLTVPFPSCQLMLNLSLFEKSSSSLAFELSHWLPFLSNTLRSNRSSNPAAWANLFSATQSAPATYSMSLSSLRVTCTTTHCACSRTIMYSSSLFNWDVTLCHWVWSSQHFKGLLVLSFSGTLDCMPLDTKALNKHPVTHSGTSQKNWICCNPHR